MEPRQTFEYDENFQNQIVALLLIDKKFYLRFSSYIKPTYFTNILNVKLVKNINVFFNEYSKFPTAVEAKSMVASRDAKVADLVAQYAQHVDVIFNTRIDTPSFIEDMVSKFCKRQEFIGAMDKSIDLITHDKIDEAKKLIDDAHSIGEEHNIGYDFFGTFDERRLSKIRNTTATLIKPLDEALHGGFGDGELILILAPPKRGKTTAIINFAAGAMYQSKFVVFVTLELSKESIAVRFESRFSGIGMYEINEQRDLVKSRIDNVQKTGAKLHILEYPSGTLTVAKLIKELEYLQLTENRKIDMIVVDYLTLMRTAGGTRGTEDLALLATELRGIGGLFRCPIIVPTQTTRYGASDKTETVTEEDIALIWEAVGICDVLITLNQTLAEYQNNMLRYYIAVNRNGPSKMEITVAINRDIMTISDVKLMEDYKAIMEKNRLTSEGMQ